MIYIYINLLISQKGFKQLFEKEKKANNEKLN